MTVLPRVVLVDDHRLFRSGVQAELRERVEVVGEADDAPTAITVVRATVPDVVLLDVHLPGGGGRAVLRRCARSCPRYGSWPCPSRTQPKT